MLGPVRLILGSERAEGQILVDDDNDDDDITSTDDK
jgi:hypothetical protein